MSKASSSSSTGLGLGAIIAAILSWQVNASFGWAILHAFCGWLYVVYWLVAK
jgi:hypothetical protein